MKRLILQISLILSITLGLTYKSAAQTSPTTQTNPYGICELPPPGCQEIPICTFYDDCFRFDFYAPKPGHVAGTTVLKYKITNFSESTFKRATFELPGVGPNRTPAILPQNIFRNRYNHSVVNPFNGTTIAYNALNAGTFSYGGFEVYYYIVNTADFNAAGKFITVTAEAGRSWQQQRTGSVLINVDECIGVCPKPTANITGPDSLCYFGDEPSFFTTDAIAGASYNWTISNATIVNGQGTNTIEVFADQELGPGQVSVTVTNQCGTASDNHLFEVVECGPIIPLPVELIEFTGRPSPSGIVLSWKTASEQNNDRFEIERSQDGRNFERIATVKGNGTSNNVNSYTYRDRTASAGINYYRLNQVDFNGASERFKIIKVSLEKTALLGIQLIPNPCADQNCSINLQGIDASQRINVEMRDLTGRLIFSKQLQGDQTSFNLPRVDSGSGVYILSVKNGDNTAYQKVIIQQ